MPQIPVYENTDTTLRPNEAASTELRAAARHIEGQYRQAGEAIQGGLTELGKAGSEVLTAQDIARGSGKFAKDFYDLQTQFTQALNENKDPAAAAGITDHFMQQFEEGASKWRDTMSTEQSRRWADSHIERWREDFQAKVHAENAHHAGQAIVSGITETVNAAKSHVFMDPAALQTHLDTIDATIDGIGKTQSGLGQQQYDEIAKLKDEAKSQIVEQAIRGAIRQNPQAGLAMLKSEKWAKYVRNPDELLAHFEAERRADQTDALRGFELRRMAREEANDATAKKLYQMATVDAAGVRQYPPNFAQTLQDNAAGLSASGYIALERDYHESILGLTQEKHQQNFNEAMNRAMLPEGDPNRLTPESLRSIVGANGLSSSEYSEVLKALDMPTETKAGIKQLDDLLKNTFGTNAVANTDQGTGPDPGALYRAQTYMWQQIRQITAAGGSLQEALDPNSLSYIFRGGMQQFQSYVPGGYFGIGEKNTQNKPLVIQQGQIQTQLHRAVQVAVGLARLRESGDLEAINEVIKQVPEIAASGADARKDNWCAALVNYALGQVGLKGTESELAKDFHSWGFPVDPGQVQPDDLFILPPQTPNSTGHIGFVAAIRQGPKGMEVQTISSSGVKWQHAGEMEFRRYMPTIEEMHKPNVMQHLIDRATGKQGALTSETKVADAINPHHVEPGSIPSFAGRNPDTRGNANYPRPPLVPIPGSGSSTGQVG